MPVAEDWVFHIFIYVGAVDNPSIPLRSTHEPWLEEFDTFIAHKYGGYWGGDIVAEKINPVSKKKLGKMDG